MSNTHKTEALQLRREAASHQLEDAFYPDIRRAFDPAGGQDPNAYFSKLLEHGADGRLTSDGEAAFIQMTHALYTCDLPELGAVPLAVEEGGEGGARRLLVNPTAAFAFELSGAEGSQLEMPAPPEVNSKEAAAELVEVYGNMLLRDVPFGSYRDNPLAKTVARALTAFGDAYKGPKTASGEVTPDLLFRGTTDGDQAGNYLSQFLLLPFFPLFPSGCAPYVGQIIGVGNLDLNGLARDQKYPIPRSPADGGQEFVNTEAEFVAIQNGELPRTYAKLDYDTQARYLTRGRDMGGLVHIDSPYEAYYNALNTLVFRGAPGNPAFPFGQGDLRNQANGHTMGASDIYTLIGRACIAAFKAAWAHKWLAWRRLRPEAMAARVHFRLKGLADLADGAAVSRWLAREGVGAGMHPSLLKAGGGVLNAVRQRTEGHTLLLSQMYPEGSPAHPSYPSGHATVAGACTTVLKAFFNGDAALPQLPGGFTRHSTGYVQTTLDGTALLPYDGALTLGGELDKLASNIAHARDFGGVHFRADGDQGMALGEQVALRLLRDHARTYPEPGFAGFELRLRSGVKVTVTAEGVTEIPEVGRRARVA